MTIAEPASGGSSTASYETARGSATSSVTSSGPSNENHEVGCLPDNVENSDSSSRVSTQDSLATIVQKSRQEFINRIETDFENKQFLAIRKKGYFSGPNSI